MRFLTHDTFNVPFNEEIKGVMPAEAIRAEELTEQGVLEAMHVAADFSGAWLIWNCESQAALEEAHETLPLHKYLDSEIIVLAEL